MANRPVEKLLEVALEPVVETVIPNERDVKRREELVRRRIESKGEKIEEQVERLHAPKGMSLCFRCTHSHIYRRKAEFNVVIRCHQLSDCAEVADDITQCNRFKQSGQITIWELMQIAQPILIDGKDSAGFYW